MIGCGYGSFRWGRPCYLLPLRWETDDGLAELTGYLRSVAKSCDVLVVDGSPEPLFLRHRRCWYTFARHIRPHSDLTYHNGKVNGVITGMRMTSAERVVIADDDVRYDSHTLAEVLSLLDHADLVIPQNYFAPLPWHAAWDSSRILLNRCLGMDYPGTLAVRSTAFHRAGCYDGDVLFENLELIQTLQIAGAQVMQAPHVFVRRLPPSLRRFIEQRVRQAYDSFGQPTRLAVELALLPAAALAFRAGRFPLLLAAAGAGIGLAELGRRRAQGIAVFPPHLSWFAPVWLTERSVCSWLALLCRLRGGVRYAGNRLRRAATPIAELRRRAAAHSDVRSVKPRTHMRPVAERLDR